MFGHRAGLFAWVRRYDVQSSLPTLGTGTLNAALVYTFTYCYNDIIVGNYAKIIVRLKITCRLNNCLDLRFHFI